MSRKAARQQVGVALFPFLAVLICTMGALIVLLVLLVQQARVDASLISARKSGSPSGADDHQMRERLEDAQWKRDLLEKSRTAKIDELTDSRAKLAHLEEHAQRLADHAKELFERARSIEEGKKLRAEDLTAAKAEADRLKDEINRKRIEAAEARKKQASKEQSYALIPYDGPSGTRRRPIYIECTEFGVVIQPEGLILRADDFSGPLGPGNPLDMALRAIREHIERTAGDKAGQPYPLLVVRPGGIIAYGAARAAMKAWDDEFGYELISDEKALDFGQADPALSAALNKTVAVARQRQAAMVDMMPRRYPGDEPLKSFAAEPATDAAGSRFVGGGGGGGFGSGTGTGNGAGLPGGGARGGAGSGLPNGGSGGMPGTVGKPAQAPLPGSRGVSGGVGAPLAGAGTYGGGGGGYGNGQSPSGSTAGGGLPTAANGGGQGSGFVGGVGGATGMAGGSGAGSFPGSPLNGGGGGSGGGLGSGTSGYGTGSGQSSAAPTLGSAGGSAMAGGGSPSGGSASGGQPGGTFDSTGGSGASGGQVSASYGSAGGAGGSSAMGPMGQPGGSSMGGSNMSFSSGAPGQAGPTLNFGAANSGSSSSPSGSSSAKSGSKSGTNRGRNWALQNVKLHQIGVTRPIHISVLPDQIVIVPERGDDRRPQVVQVAPELTPDDVNHFVTAVQNEVKGWGLAVSDGYWKPVLQADVSPDAERHFTNLRTALSGSGIEVMRR
jgi:hypothetical protein